MGSLSANPAPKWPWALGVFVACVYAFSFAPLSDGQLLGNDVIPYARGLVTGNREVLLNPHHLLQHPLAWLLYRGQELLGAEPGMATALRAQTLLSALAGGWLAAQVARYAAPRVGSLAALGMAAALAASAGQWLYGSVGETYLPATATLAWVLVRAMDSATSSTQQSPTWRADAPLAIGFCLALLLRQDSVLACAALAILLPAKSAARVIGTAGVGSLVAYFAVWFLGVRGGEHGLAHSGEFQSWLRGLAETGLWGQSPDSESLLLGAGVQQLAWHYGAQPVYAVGWQVLSWLTTIALLVGSAVARSQGHRSARILLGLGAFALLRFGFFAWWQPTNLEYHGGTWLPIVLGLVHLRAGSTPTPKSLGLREPWAWVALSLSVSHGILLWAPYRQSQIHARTLAALSATQPDTSSQHPPAGSVLALDLWSVYSLQRADLDGPWVDVSEAAAGRAPKEPWIARASEVLKAGGRVVLTRELLLMGRLGLGELPLDAEFLDALVAMGQVESVVDEQSRPYLMVISAPQGAQAR